MEQDANQPPRATANFTLLARGISKLPGREMSDRFTGKGIFLQRLQEDNGKKRLAPGE